MEIVRIGNQIEGCFWICISLVFFVPLLKAREKQRWFCLMGFLLFLIFGLSDFVESQTGAWWKPWWLLVWKAGCNLGFLGMLLWYKKIMGSWQNIWDKWHKPIKFK